jgi:DnaK suppressor protein
MSINAVRELLQKRRTELRTRADHIGEDLRNAPFQGEGAFADQAAAHANDAVLEAIGESAEVELQQIDDALRRIEAGSYGRCSKCGVPIGPERLQAVPYASTCIVCGD